MPSKLVNILLIEDNPGDIVLVKDALKEYGIEHTLCVATDGEEALEFIEHAGEPGYAARPDLLLLDLNLPKRDGPEVLRELRRNPRYTETPVIIVSSADRPHDRTKVAAFNIKHYFRKPINYDEYLLLGQVIRDVMTQVRA